MLSRALALTAGSFGHASHSLRASVVTHRRTLFYPSASPPSPESIPQADYPAQSRAHVSREQFHIVRQYTETSAFSDPAFGNLYDGHQHPASGQIGSTPEERWKNMADDLGERIQAPPDIFAGRTVFVRKTEGVGQAYAKLQSILRMNNVRKELRSAERHEKKGEKRRRLRSERWRRKFADEVRKKVKLVTEIRLRDRMWGARH